MDWSTCHVGNVKQMPAEGADPIEPKLKVPEVGVPVEEEAPAAPKTTTASKTSSSSS